MATPYCEIQDIKDDFKKIVFTDANAPTPSAVTLEQLSDWIDQESSYIDGRIGLRYVVPFVHSNYPDASLVLKRICIFRVSERVRSKTEVKSNVSQALASEEKSNTSRVRTPNDDLDLIIKGLLLLSGVPLISQGSGVSSFNTDVGYKHKFKINRQQW